MKIELGQEVEYLPDVCHATNPCRTTGDYPWVIGLKRVRQDNSTTPPTKETYVEELTDAKISEYFRWLSRSDAEFRERERQNLVFLRPKRPWKAVVREVNEDGTLNLDVESNQGGVTLHYDNIPLDQSGARPHTCRLPKKK